MEDAPLNKAHQEYRFAERHLRYRRFDEAVLSHQRAAAYLTEAMRVATSTKAVESLQCQHEYHVKQQDIIRHKKLEYENFKRAMETKRHKMTNQLLHDLEANKQQMETIQMVYKTMNEADSLLELLTIKEGVEVSGGAGDECDSAVVPVPVVVAPPLGSKKPKDDRTVIEELRTVNQQLHELISQLVTQLEGSTRENEVLRERIRQLEDERMKQPATAAVVAAVVLPPPCTAKGDSKSSTNTVQVVTDSSGATSPYVFSPCSELSPDVIANYTSDGDPDDTPPLVQQP